MKFKKLLHWYSKTWIESTTSFDFYRNLSTRSLKNALAFVFISYGIISLVQTGFFVKTVLPKWTQFIQKIPNTIENQLTPDARLQWNGAELKFSPEQTLSLRLPTKLVLPDMPATLFFWGASDQESAIFNLTTNNLVIHINNQAKDIPLTEILEPNQFSLSKIELIGFLQTTTDNITKMLQTLPYFLPLIFLLNFVFSRSLFLFLETTLLYVILRIYRQPKQIKELTKLTLHILVLAEVINQWSLLILEKIPISMLSLSFWLLLIVVLLKQQKNPHSLHRH